MLGTQQPLIECMRTLQERFSLRVFTLQGVKPSQSTQAHTGVGILGTQDTFLYRQGTLEQGFGLRILALMHREDGQLRERDSDIGMLRPLRVLKECRSE